MSAAVGMTTVQFFCAVVPAAPVVPAEPIVPAPALVPALPVDPAAPIEPAEPVLPPLPLSPQSTAVTNANGNNSRENRPIVETVLTNMRILPDILEVFRLRPVL